jgi:hypothetical protein
LWRDEDLNGSRFSGLSCDKALAFEGENHLVDGGRRDLEMAAQIGLGGWPFVDRRIGVNEGEILALMNIVYRVELSQDERLELTTLLSGGTHAVCKVKRAQILLAADAG